MTIQREAVTVAMVTDQQTRNCQRAAEVIVRFAQRLDLLRPVCAAHSAAQHAIVTRRDSIPTGTLQKINWIVGTNKETR